VGLRGPKPNWLKEKCREIVETNELVEFLGDVATGKNVEQVVTDQGEVIRVPAPVSERRRAIQELMDRGWGKPVQGMEVSGIDGDPLPGISAESIRGITEALRQRIAGGTGEKS
jgi:hypothetical protein